MLRWVPVILLTGAIATQLIRRGLGRFRLAIWVLFWIGFYGVYFRAMPG